MALMVFLTVISVPDMHAYLIHTGQCYHGDETDEGKQQEGY